MSNSLWYSHRFDSLRGYSPELKNKKKVGPKDEHFLGDVLGSHDSPFKTQVILIFGLLGVSLLKTFINF